MNKKILMLLLAMGQVFAASESDMSVFTRLYATTSEQVTIAETAAREVKANLDLRKRPSMEEFFSTIAKVKHEVMMQEGKVRQELFDYYEINGQNIRTREIGFLLPQSQELHNQYCRFLIFENRSCLRDTEVNYEDPYFGAHVLRLYDTKGPFFLKYSLRDRLKSINGLALAFGLQENTGGFFNLKVCPFTKEDSLIEGGILSLCSSIEKTVMTPLSKAKLFASIVTSGVTFGKLSYDDLAPDSEGNPDFVGLTGFYINLRKNGLDMSDFKTYVFNPLKPSSSSSSSFVDAYSAYVLKTDEDDMLLYAFEGSAELLQQLKALCAPASTPVAALAAAASVAATDDE